MKIMIFGSEGQLGQCLRDQLINHDYKVMFCSKGTIDITEKLGTQSAILSYKPDIVINAAAYTDVDRSEADFETAHAVNVTAVETIAECCKEIDAVLIHISTDYVFDGKSTKPYSEDSDVNPICVYGKTKLLGEYAIQNIDCKHLIIRTSWLFSMYGKNFLTTMLALGSSKHIVKVVNDEFGCPTYAPDLAYCILYSLKIIRRREFNSGIYHFTGRSTCSWYDFSIQIFAQAKILGYSIPNSVLPIKSDNYPTLAKRPYYSVLNNTKFEKEFIGQCTNLDLAISEAIYFIKTENS